MNAKQTDLIIQKLKELILTINLSSHFSPTQRKALIKELTNKLVTN